MVRLLGQKPTLFLITRRPFNFSTKPKGYTGSQESRELKVKKEIKAIIDSFEEKLKKAGTLEELEEVLDVTSFANYFFNAGDF